jgi:hypothetical protein
MSIPNVTMRFVDGGLGIVTPGPGGAQFKIGVSLSGTPYTIYACGNSRTADSSLAGGPLHDAVRQVTDVAGTTVYAVPCAIESAGSISPATLTHTGTGAEVVSATSAPHVQILAKCVTAGSLGTAAFQFSVNGGAYGATVTSTDTSFPYRVPGTFCTLTFATGSYRENDVYTITTAGVVTVTAGGSATVTQVSSPLDAYSLLVTIDTAGDRGTSRFTYSLDGGVVTSSPIATAATYVIPNSGIVLAFTDAASVLGDTYEATCTPPATNNTDIALAFDALLASQYIIEGGHVVGTPLSSADAAALATAVDGKMTTAATNKRYQFCLMECPTGGADTDDVLIAAFANTTSTYGRTYACAGNAYVTSTASGLTLSRNCAWVTSARLASSKLSEDPGKVLLGPLPNVTNITRNEEATPGCHDARFVTLRTILGKNGYFITGAPSLALVTSDYNNIMNVRVVNRAAAIANAAYTDYLNVDVRVDRTTGFIDPRDADAIDAKVTQALQAELMGAPGTRTDECSFVQAKVNRTDNLLTNSTVNATVAITPKAYAHTIYVNIGFTNPALQG